MPFIAKNIDRISDVLDFEHRSRCASRHLIAFAQIVED
jgi:hypothetical protein